MAIDEEMNGLFALPLEEFTAARDALAKQLRSSGGTTDAATVKALKKPNLAAWALNQTARAYPEEIDELFAATERVRSAQRRVMSGGKSTELRAATDDRNSVVSKLTKLARSILEEGGHPASQSAIAALNDSFMAVASDEEGAELLREGRLSRELKPQAVVDVGGLTLVRSPAPDVGTGETSAGLDDARRELDVARRRSENAAAAAEKAEADARRLSEAAEFARRGADARGAEAQEAAKALDEAAARVRKLGG